MNRIKFGAALALIVAGTSSVMGCAAEARQSGQLEVFASTRQAVTAGIDHVAVTLTADDIATPITGNLVYSNGRFSGELDAIPAGSNRTIHADALDADGNTLFTDTLNGVVIASGSPTMIALVFQDNSPSAPFADAAPVIDGVEASSDSTTANGNVSFNVWAHDPDDGDSLTFLWSATDGSFNDATAVSPTWTAPGSDGTFTVKVTVTDSKGVATTLSLEMPVGGNGTALISARFNTWPSVSLMSGTPASIDAHGTTKLTATASDPDGDPLSYSWSSDCDGSFDAPTAASPNYTLNTLPASGECGFTVTVSDGQGGSNHGTLQLQAASAPPVIYAPTLDSASQSANQVAPGDTVTFQVASHGHDGAAIAFGWNCDQGTLSGQSDTDGTSQITWTAPADFTGTADISVQIVDVQGSETDHDFTVDAS